MGPLVCDGPSFDGVYITKSCKLGGRSRARNLVFFAEDTKLATKESVTPTFASQTSRRRVLNSFNTRHLECCPGVREPYNLPMNSTEAAKLKPGQRVHRSNVDGEPTLSMESSLLCGSMSTTSSTPMWPFSDNPGPTTKGQQSHPMCSNMPPQV